MLRELKIILFACFSLIIAGSFIPKLLETKDVITALVFTGQVILIQVGAILFLLLFIWIGSKIFRD